MRWVNKNDHNKIYTVVKYPLKHHIWGMYKGKMIPIHIFDVIIDAPIYLEILSENMSDKYCCNENIIYQGDDDSKHNGTIVKL